MARCRPARPWAPVPGGGGRPAAVGLYAHPMTEDALREGYERFEAAREALGDGRLEEARAGFERAIELGWETTNAWFDLGLVHKFRRAWAESVRCNRRALELDASNEEAAWNLGVAATALRDWDVARSAWQRLGLDVGADGPPAADYGIGPVRLNATPDGEGEVVWGHRIDPCRMRLASVPLPESGHRWGDVVLHDVVPRGERRVGDRAFPVFDEIARMDPSPHVTHRAWVTATTESDLDALREAAEVAGLGVEDWTASIRFVCVRCSLSSPHAHDASGAPVELVGRRELGMAGDRRTIEEVLERWAAVGESRTVEAVEAAE